MQDKRLSMIVLLLVTLFALAIITGCIVRAIIAPPSIALLAPANGATDQPTALVLTWEATPGVSKNKKIPPEIVEYRFYIALLNEDYGDWEPTEDKQAEPKGLEYDTAYKWKVEAIQSDNQIGESEEWTFTTEKKQYAAPQIELTDPASGATDLATTVTLTWEATEGKQTNAGEREGVNITEYRVYHKKTGDPDPTEPATTTEKSYNLTNLEYAATYTWYVVALQSDGQQATSTESTFTTQAVQYDIPEIALKSPGNRVGGQPTTVNLTWEATPGKQTNVGERAPTIEGYLVYFGVYGQNYGNPEPVTATQTTKPGLAYGTTYKWQVVALQSNEKRATSTEWTFTTLAPVYG
ncbi:MAG TPA: fibronectin type III domain-containing protein [Thermotogota bacterium]|nr:fibronectin type III domain-containing protein [Thermotogota bacterium]